MYKHVVVGTDGSKSALLAVESAAEIAACFGAALTMAYVRPLTPITGFGEVPLSDEYVEMEEEDFKAKMREVIDSSRPSCDKRNLKFDSTIVRGVAGESLVQVAKELNADLLVVGYRGRGALQTFFLGSTTKYVVTNAKCSVLVVHCPKGAH